ncbi:coiled-coil domain-containing protein [Hymenobacter fodinae]|uniref:Uncharacterized protein n=1 Tax=Hymenobacter fodinae TaxID=2510796 RepID=A0A4Z0P8H6_9BACT|nr:hypothetical protein [Hymenobacter fodinae]TGE08258.1 hypothetical protein EU556_11080 [Hymenobacter fodinae]
MANQKKVYTIEIQMDSARQQLADATKRLEQLDQQLEGIDKDSDVGKALVAEMAKAAKEVESLTDEVGDLGSALDNLKPGTVGALKAEIEELEAAFEASVIGTKEQEEALLKLGQAKGQLKELEDAVDALDPKMKAAAFVDFANGVVGAFSVATVAAETFGLSSSQAEEYQKKLLSLITVLEGVDQVSKALNSETLSVIKSSVASAKAWLGVGEAAQTSGKMTRGALLASGIGAALVLITLLAANWDKVTEATSRFALRFKPQLDAIKSIVSATVDNVRDLLSVVTFGLVDSADQAARAAAKAAADAQAQIASEARARRIALLEAEGRDVSALKARQIAEDLKRLKTGTAEELKAFRDKYNELLILEAQYKKQQKDQALAEDLARLNAQIALQTAKGKETFDLQVKLRQRELKALQEAVERDGAAITAKMGEIDAIRAAKKKAAADKAAAAEKERLQKEYDAFKERVVATEKEQFQDLDAAEKRKAERQRQAFEKYAPIVNEGNEKIQKQLAAEAEERAKQLAPISFSDNVLIRVFGLRPDQLDAAKEAIAQSAQILSESINSITSTLFADATAAADEQLQLAQQRYDEISSKLDAATSKREASEEALKSATGARRDYLLQKIQKERAEEERLANQKAKAAAAEQEAAAKKAKLEKQQQQLTAASTLAASAYNSVIAVQAALEAVKSGSKMPFPLNIAAVVASLAAVASTVVQARSLGKSLGAGGTLENGGEIVGGSHASGNDVPVLGGKYRVEGGEMITPVDATQRNRAALELIRTQGRKRTLLPADFAQAGAVRVLPSPSRSGAPLAAGGVLEVASGSNTGATAGSSSSSALELLLAQANGLLAEIATHTQSAADRPDPVLQFGPSEALSADQQLQVARDAGAPVRL